MHAYAGCARRHAAGELRLRTEGRVGGSDRGTFACACTRHAYALHWSTRHPEISGERGRLGVLKPPQLLPGAVWRSPRDRSRQPCGWVLRERPGVRADAAWWMPVDSCRSSSPAVVSRWQGSANLEATEANLAPYNYQRQLHLASEDRHLVAKHHGLDGEIAVASTEESRRPGGRGRTPGRGTRRSSVDARCSRVQPSKTSSQTMDDVLGTDRFGSSLLHATASATGGTIDACRRRRCT